METRCPNCWKAQSLPCCNSKPTFGAGWSEMSWRRCCHKVFKGSGCTLDYSKKKKKSCSVNCFCIFFGPLVFIFVDCVNLLWGMSSPCVSLVQGSLTWLLLSDLYNSPFTHLIWLSGVSTQTCSQNHHFDPLLSFDFLKNSLSDERVQLSEQNVGVFSAEVWVCWKCFLMGLSSFSQPQ